MRRYFRTIHDMNDGFGGKTGSCREYTVLRDDQDHELIGGFVDTPGSVQFVTSEAHVVLINMELRYRYRLCRETDLTLGSWYPEAHTATWMNLGTTEKTLFKTLRWWVLQALSDHTQQHQALRKTHASKQQEQSILKNYTSEEIIQIDKKLESGMIFLPLLMSKSILLPGSIENIDSTRTTSRNRRSSSLGSMFPKLRRDFERDGRCSNLLRLSMAGSKTQRKQQTQISSNNTKMERILVSCRKLLHRELDPTSRAHRWWKGHWRRVTDGLLHTFTPKRWRNRRRIRWFTKAGKSALQEQVDNFSGRSLLGQCGKSTR